MNIFGRTAITGAALAAAALMAAGPVAAEPAAPGPDAATAAALDASIVWVDVNWTGLVEVPFDDGTVATYEASTVSYCTGWFVSERGHVATAGHCLEQSPDIAAALIATVVQEQGLDVGYLTLDDLLATWRYQVDDPIAYVGQPSVVDGPISGQSIIAQVVDVQPFDNGDNALLRVNNLSDTPALAIADAQPEVNQDVVAVGFAGSVDRVTDTDRQPPSHKRGYVSSLSTSSKGAPITEIDAAITQGMSGGPTVNADGEVIGINSFLVRGESQPFNFITDTEGLRTFLAEQGVETPAATDKPGTDKPGTDKPGTDEPGTDKPGTDQPGIEPVGASSDPTAPAQDQPTQSSSAQAPVQQAASTSSSSNTVLLIAVIALGALLLVGGAITAVVLRRRSRPTPPAAGPQGGSMVTPLPQGPVGGPHVGPMSTQVPSQAPNGMPVPVPGPGFPQQAPEQGQQWNTWNR